MYGIHSITWVNANGAPYCRLKELHSATVIGGTGTVQPSSSAYRAKRPNQDLFVLLVEFKPKSP
jgi:hypothetical protein